MTHDVIAVGQVAAAFTTQEVYEKHQEVWLNTRTQLSKRKLSHPAGMTFNRRKCLQPVSCNQRARRIRPSADVMSEFLPFSGCTNWY